MCDGPIASKHRRTLLAMRREVTKSRYSEPAAGLGSRVLARYRSRRRRPSRTTCGATAVIWSVALTNFVKRGDGARWSGRWAVVVDGGACARGGEWAADDEAPSPPPGKGTTGVRPIRVCECSSGEDGVDRRE